MSGVPCIRVSDISLEPFREAFERMEPAQAIAQGRYPKDAANTIAVRFGWFTRTGAPDGPRVRRVLGLRPWGAKLQKGVTPQMARRLCEVMDIDPFEIEGL